MKTITLLACLGLFLVAEESFSAPGPADKAPRSDAETASAAPEITPAPQQCEMQASSFVLGPQTVIRCKQPETPRQKHTLSLLQGAIETHCGLTPRVKPGDLSSLEIVIATDGAAPPKDTSPSVPDQAEGYRLEISPEAVVIRGVDEAGLFYGVETFRQLVQARKKSLPCLRIDDWPDVALRGYAPFCHAHRMDPRHRGREFYKQLAGYCAAHKLNVMAIEVGMLPDDADLRAVGEFCRLNFIEPVPYHPFIHLRAKPMVTRVVNADEKEFEGIMGPFHRALRTLKPKIFCIAGDELVTSFTVRNRQSIYSADQLRQRPGHEWLALCLKRFNSYITERGVRMAMWADSLIDEQKFEGAPSVRFGYGGNGDDHCKMVDDLPKDIIMWDWQYEPQVAFSTMDYLQAKGFDTIGGPKGTSWNTALFAEYAHKTRTKKFMGMICTDWSGPKGVSYVGVARAGDCFWSVGKYAQAYPTNPSLTEAIRPAWPSSGDGPGFMSKMPFPLDERFEQFKQQVANNPLRNIAPGSHHIVIQGEPIINGRLLAAMSYGSIKARLAAPGGMLTKNHQRALVTYLVEARSGSKFTGGRLMLKLNDRMENSIAVATGREGDNYTDLGNIADGKKIDLTAHIKGSECFRYRLTSLNVAGAHLVFLRGIELDCTVE